MPVPVIDPTTSVLSFLKGEFFVYQPAATETPTSWAAVGLPTGVTINTTTGKISGAATEPGVYNVTLTATNGSGTSTPLFVAIGIEASDFAADASILLDVDLATGIVTNPGVSSTGDTPAPPLYCKRGDKILISVGFKQGGYLQDIPVDQLDLAIKEFEPESLLILSDGVFEKLGSYDTARYQFLVHLDPDELTNILSSYEDDASTHVDAVAELRWSILHARPGEEDPSSLERSSQNFTLRLARDLAPDIT